MRVMPLSPFESVAGLMPHNAASVPAEIGRSDSSRLLVRTRCGEIKTTLRYLCRWWKIKKRKTRSPGLRFVERDFPCHEGLLPSGYL